MFTKLVALGLVLDIVGAGVIAAPDIPGLDRSFRFGRLRASRRKMETGGLSKGESGFEEIKQIVAGLNPLEDFSDSQNQDLEKIVVHSRSGMQSDTTYQSNVNWGDEYVEGRYSSSEDASNTAFYDTGEVYRALFEQLEPAIRKFRLAGFLMLALGFLLQLLGTVMNSPA